MTRPTPRHSPIFHQVEGLCVDTNITFSDLKGTLDYAMKALFGSSVKTRFFPSFLFPFTEPSADVQTVASSVVARAAASASSRVGSNCWAAAWSILRSSAFAQEKQPAYDPKKISGFAFGMGVERIAKIEIRHQRNRQFYAGDMRFLGQFV